MPRKRSVQEKCPSQAWGLPFKGNPNVYTDFYGDVWHHHRSHTYVYFYSSNKAVLITNWTSKHIVSTVNKVNVNSVKCVSITLQSSPRVHLINIYTLATGWAFPCHRTDVYCHCMGISCHRSYIYCHRMDVF